MQRHRTRGGRVATAVAVAALLVLAWPRPAPAQAPPASELLIYAASYVADFVVRFANVVAEERYEQWFVNGLQQRELVSDFLIVQLPSSNDWASFRDVFEVDGEPVGNRQERLLSLLLDGSSTSTLERARAISREGARFNLEGLGDLNDPLLVLASSSASTAAALGGTSWGTSLSSGPTCGRWSSRSSSAPR